MNKLSTMNGRTLLITTVAVMVGLIGCGTGNRTVNPSEPAATFVYVIDYSTSTEQIRKQELGQMLSELENLPGETNVIVMRMGFETQEIFSGTLGDSGTDTLLGTLKRDVASSDPVQGTNFGKMADAIVMFEKRFTGKDFNLRIMTDGMNDFNDANDLKHYRQSAKTAASDKRLSSLLFFGVRPGFREQIRSVFGAAGSKMQIYDQDQLLAE